MSIQNLKTIALALIILLCMSQIAPASRRQPPQPAQSYQPVSQADGQLSAAPVTSGYIIEGNDGGAVCRDASPEESQALAAHDLLVPLQIISPAHQDGISPQDAGLKIILRGTPQLESFPQAKAAFLKAAETWEAVIRSPITIVIDVDYGPGRFGEPFPDPNILGSTGTQQIGSGSIYPTVRSSLLAQASSGRESELYNGLPVGLVQTDLGSTAALSAPSAPFRALGIIGAVADPAGEAARLGPPPAIGFNSAFQFDFNPADGIDAGKTDFDAVAVHEIGHALGFDSNAGLKEMFPSDRVAPSLLDLLRVRPGVTPTTFPTAPRIQTSGGAQVFFSGNSELALSTGRPDSTGGDGRQSGHWKDDEFTGQYLGIMDPTLPAGVRKTITNNDLLALDAIGYQVGATEDDTAPLTSGIARSGSISAPSAGNAILGSTQYTVQVPAGASQLTVELGGNQDVDLYVRAGQRITPGSSGPAADYISDSPTGAEAIRITPASSPPLRAGAYFIAVANYGPGAASFSVKATITASGGDNRQPVITSLRAELNGNELVLTGVADDADGDIVQAQSNLLDGSGRVVGQTQPFDVNFGGSTTVNFRLTISGMNSVPSATQASLVLIDRRGARSAAKTADFGDGDQGGPILANASYNGSKLVIKGSGFASQVLVEINGRVVSLSPSATARKINVKGDPDRLNLRSGANRLCVLNGDRRSNLFVLEF